MKFKKLFIAAGVLLTTVITAQNLNVTLQGQLAYPGQTCANICGYVDSLGNEYALVGASVGLSIVDVTNPTTPTQVYQHIGPANTQSEWQEIKVRGKYAYVTTEAGGGLQIFNLSSLPDVAGIVMHSYTGDSTAAGNITGTLNSIHALHIDNNFVYLYGSNLFNGGALVVDVTDPWNPTYAGNYSVGVGTARYVHDGYVRNDTLYAGHIYQGYFTVVDFTNKLNPVELASQLTPSHFTHNTWLSTNSKTLFTTDEVSNSFLTSYDITNLNNITELDRIQSNPGSGSIVHNTHIIRVAGNDYAVTSWYRDGFTITDVGRPQNMVQVGNYDTYSGSGTGFDGDWGVYPYLPSGTIVVSNINEGLFVFSPNYVRACYLEGIVTDSVTGFPINSASIQIQTTSVLDHSNFSGNYATGLPSPGGTYTVTYSKPGYYPKTISGVSLSSGIVTTQSVALAPLQTFALSGQVIVAGTGTPVANADVTVFNSNFNFQTTTNASGNFTLPAVYTDTYEVIAGKWGYVTNCLQNQMINSGSGTITIPLTKGYYDDFTFDFGWTVNSTASTGMWVRDVPLGTFNGTVLANPGLDDSTDCSNMAYITGNTGVTASDEDVDNGATVLTSPVFDLTTYTNPYLDFSYWFYNAGGTGTPNDSLRIYLNNGTITSQLFFANYATPNNSSWVHQSLHINTVIAPTAAMKVIVRTADAAPGHIVEAGFDKFLISEGPTGINENSNVNTSIQVFPNPFTDETTINYELKSKLLLSASVAIIDIAGRVVNSIPISQLKGSVVLNPTISAGIYFVKLINGSEISAPVKVVKMK